MNRVCKIEKELIGKSEDLLFARRSETLRRALGDRTKTHYKVYEFQMAHPSWSKTTPEYKDFMINRYHQYLNPKR